METNDESLLQIPVVVVSKMQNRKEVEALIRDLGLILKTDKPYNTTSLICDSSVAD